jgi:LCP family protein required for cell wall assembly
MERLRQQGTGSLPAPGAQAPGAPRQPGAAPRTGRQQGTGRVARSRPGAPTPARAVPPPAQEPAISSRLTPSPLDNGQGSRQGMNPVGPGSRQGMMPVGPGSRQGMNPVGPGSRQGMSPVGPPSRSGMTPVGRLAATALAVPVKAPGAQVTDTSTAVTAITQAVPAEVDAPEEAPKQDGPERREDIDPSCLTSEMEPISDAVVQKRTIDATLARFSAVHDEMAVEEEQRRSRRIKIMPWLNKDQDLHEALSKNGPVSPATAGETQRPVEMAAESSPRIPGTRLPVKIGGKRGKSFISAKVAACGAAVLVLIACFFGWRAVHDVASGSGIQEVAALDENSPAILESQKQYSDSNFLMVGTDTRPGTSATGDLTTDTIMVVHIPADGSRVAVVSFPPNLQVNRPGCQQWNNQTNQVNGQVPAQTGVKLSSIYGIGGPRCVTDTVQQLTGLRINHFVGVDDGGFSDLVSGVQGVQLCVKQPLKDAALGTIVPQAGQVSLTGKQALNYVSADQVTGDTQIADFSRINRQQRFLAALLRKTIGQQQLLMDPSKLNNFLGTFTKSTFGDNMGVDQLVKLATSMQGLALGKITFVTEPTTGTLNSAGEESVQSGASKQLFKAVIDNSPLPGETAGGAVTNSPAKPASPADIKVQVLNGIGQSAAGWAGSTADDLRGFGYGISQIGDASAHNVTHTLIKYAASQQSQAALLATSVPSATLQVDQSMGGAIQLIIGPGFDRKVQAPHGGGAAKTGANGSPASEAPADLSYVNAADQSCS